MTVDPLFVDCFAYDLGGKPKWPVLAALGPPWHGAIIKATQGRWYSPGWFDDNWKALRSIAGDRYGVDWFRGAYHFLEFASDGTGQAELYLKTVERAGGWDTGDFWPIVDVELGNDGSKPGSKRNANQDATRQQIIDSTTAFAEKCTTETGRKVVLYGNGAMRERSIYDKMGCSYIWPARYTSTLPHEVYERAGFSLQDLLLWQYDGDGDAHLPSYPGEPPGFGKVDISVLVHEGGLDWLRANLFAERP